MADDGMLMNFAISDGAIIKLDAKLKGGSWKDRLSAKRRVHARWSGEQDRRGEYNPNHIHINTPQDTSRPSKRPRTDDGHFRPAPTSNDAAPTRTKLDVSATTPSKQQHHQSRQVISSLFTFNPVSKAAAAGQDARQSQDNEELSESLPVKPSNAPLIDDLEDFTSLGLSPIIATHLRTKMELKAPTAIQKNAIAQLLKEESDAFIQSETGSGKTLAYLLPLVQRIMALKDVQERKNNNWLTKTENGAVHRDTGLFAVVLAPTRELCKQISMVLENLLRCAHWIVAGTVIGGEKKKSEKARLRKGLNILIATPGRLADHLDNTRVLDVSHVRWLVLDEGDRLMDLGFEEELQGIVKKLDARQQPSDIVGLPTKRTTVLCSATLKMNVQRLGEISLKDAVHIRKDVDNDGPGDLEEKDDETNFSVPAQLQQSYIVAASKLRLVTLTALMKRTFARKGSVKKAMIFVSCADSVEFHFEVFTRKWHNDSTERNTEEELQDKAEEDAQEKLRMKNDEKSNSNTHGTTGLATAFSDGSNPVMIHKLHGSLPQHVRTATLSAFSRSHDASVLICTDVASRGLDVPNIDLVVEYDPAFSSDEHLHRIGRTARLGRDGRAILFLLPGSEEKYVEILKRYRTAGRALSRSEAKEILKRGFGGNSDATSRDWEQKATNWQLEVERWALEEPHALELSRRAFQSHIRAYATHVGSERNMFNIKELHLGHLAKSFALRDRPSKINVPGLRPGKEETRREFKADRKVTVASDKNKRENATKSTSGRYDRDENSVPGAIDRAEATRKMRAKMRELTGASEFNLA